MFDTAVFSAIFANGDKRIFVGVDERQYPPKGEKNSLLEEQHLFSMFWREANFQIADLFPLKVDLFTFKELRNYT